MTRKTALLITAAAVTLHGLLMPSFVRWNIGQNIRESTERHVGINPGEAYLVGEGEERLTIARELSYELDTPLIALLDENTDAQDIRMGEHFRKVKFKRHKGYRIPVRATTVGERYEPNGQPMEPHRISMGRTYLSPTYMGSVEVQCNDSHRLAVIAAAPFDYAIDPALTAVSSVAATPIVVVLAFASFGYYLWYSYC